MRKLLGEERESSLAYLLLSTLATDRATLALRHVALDESLPDDKRALAIALLGERGAMPVGIRLADERALRRRAALALAGRLRTPADVARAADLLLEQVAPEDLPALAEGLAESSGAHVSPLVDELLLRDELPRPVRNALRELRRRVGDAVLPPVAAAAPARVRIGRGADGSHIVLCARGGGGTERLLCASLGAGGLGAASYDAEARPGAWRRASAKAEAAGYVLRDASPSEAAALVARAARASRAAGARLPRGYYLGRDLLGLYDEHATAEAAGGTRSLHVKSTSLSRGTQLLAKRDIAGARRAFAAYVLDRPEDAEGRSCLGLCLLELGEHEEALRELARAARLEPDEPLRHWNLAAAAREAGKPGTCYLALRDYERSGDRGRGAAARRRSARGFLDGFARFVAVEHPAADAEDIARGEEIFDRAYRHLVAGRFDDAATGFEAVVKLVPSHYASWGNLGAAYARLGRLADAERCLRRALDVRPDYEPAQRNLAAILE
ncbi:MAG TPA: tetratricopeptide repeat protein [Haliangiales bacterium]|nr:tetratricopeptide repeat protein [Haliangiales bacterium]